MQANAKIIVGLAALLAGSCPLSGNASYINLQVKPAAVFNRQGVTVRVAVTNKGDEPAMAVQIQAALGARTAQSEAVESLDVGETCRAAFSLGPAPQPPGVHTVILRTRYADANGYLFTALESIPLVTAEPDMRAQAVGVSAMSAVLWKRGKLAVTVTSGAPEPLDARLTLALPDELLCDTPTRDIRLPAGEGATVSFDIRNGHALDGSRYVVIGVLDFEQNGRHASVGTQATVAIDNPYGQDAVRKGGLCLIIVLLCLFIVLQFKRPQEKGAGRLLCMLRAGFPMGVLCLVEVFLLYHLTPSLLLSDTLAVGGDTPAHNYLASHLREQLFGHGRIVSWADGWWCGFPMFQFYFALPYLVTAVLSLIVPFNIAFKLAGVSGLLLLPVSAYAAARMAKLPRPVPSLMAVATVPLLFDTSHMMWGVNIYSTLAGMVSNSLSFSLMLLFLAAAARDSEDGRFRLRTAFLYSALLLSHFFTSLMAALTAALLPFLPPRAGTWKALKNLAAECGLAALLMAWWIIPLAAKREYSVAFGVNWNVSVLKTLPTLLLWLTPLIVAAIVLSFPALLGKRGRRLPPQSLRFVGLMVGLLGLSCLLFQFGYGVLPVFVNVRFWPFLVYALLALAATGAGLLLRPLRARELGVLVLLTAALTYGVGRPNTARAWARWNYEGLERKARWPVWKELVLPLQGTPGRLANDLNAANQSLGSSRIFECVPHAIGKPVLEGGIVNSAVGSLFAYYVQSETSKSCAGAPNLVHPASFNVSNATRHLELFNVKHFIAKWSGTKRALAESQDWQRIGESQGWALYELITHNGSYVFVPENLPVAFRTDRWKEAGLQWIYSVAALDRPVALLGDVAADTEEIGTTLTRSQFSRYIRATASPSTPAPSPCPASDVRIWDETVGDNRIRFRTNAIGMPHIIKCTHYPNWKVKGARRVYRVTPCFMLVYPCQEEVELYFGYTLSDIAGKLVSFLALSVVAVLAGKRLKSRARGGTPQGR